jgi:beta-lactamase regulating signal transducer with metallopeptidase domain
MVEWLLLNTLTAAGLAVLILVLGRPLRLGPAVRHALWLVVLVKLLTPPLVRWPWPLPIVGPARVALERADPPVLHLPPTVDAEDRFVPVENREPQSAPGTLTIATDHRSVEPATEPAPVAEAKGQPAARLEVLGSAALALWIAGGLVVLLVQAVRIVRFQRRLVGLRPAPTWLGELVGELARGVGVRRPRVGVLAGLASPVVWGFGPARLLWPEGLEGCLSAEGRRAVLVHELAHLRRRDHWTGWLILAAGCVLWWHPLFWFACRRLVREAELACDAQVIAALPEARRTYAEALIDVMGLAFRPVPAHALGATGRRRDLERRLVMILRGQSSGRLSHRALLAVGVLALLALPAWTPGQAPANKPDKQNAPPPADKPSQGTAVLDLDKDGTPDLFIIKYLDGGTVLDPNQPNPPAAQSERDKKLKEVEEKLKALLKEVQALRAGEKTETQGTLHRNANPFQPFPDAPSAAKKAIQGALQRDANTFPQFQQSVPVDVIRNANPNPWGFQPAVTQPNQPLNYFYTVAPLEYKLAIVDNTGPVEVALSRTTYSLPKAKAEALAAFLREHVKAQVMETKAEGDSLTVTTTPQAQKAIGGLVALIQGKEPARVNPPANQNNAPAKQ